MPKIKTDEEIRTVFMPKINAFVDERLTADNAKRIYDFLKPYHYDTDGRRLYEAAKGLLNADIYSEYPAAYTDFFDSLDGYTQLKWLETAKFADKNNERLWSNREFMPSQHELDDNSPQYKDYQDKLYTAAIRGIIISLLDKQPYLLEGFWNRLSYIENILGKGFPTRDDLTSKLDREAESLHSSGLIGDEYNAKRAIYTALRETSMTDEMVQALIVTDNVLDAAYNFFIEDNAADQIYLAVWKYLDKAEHDYLADRVYDRAKMEYEDYIDMVKEKSKDQIIAEAYKITILYDLQCSLDPYPYSSLSTERLKALHSHASPLWSLYDEWQSRDCSYMEDIKDVIIDTADRINDENREQGFEAGTEYEDEDEQEI